MLNSDYNVKTGIIGRCAMQSKIPFSEKGGKKLGKNKATFPLPRQKINIKMLLGLIERRDPKDIEHRRINAGLEYSIAN